MHNFFITLLILSPTVQCGRIVAIESDVIEKCNDISDWTFYDLKIIQSDDVTFYLNGTVHFKDVFISPLRVIVTTQKFIRGQWVNGEYYRVIKNMCPVFHNQNEPWAVVFKNFPENPCSVRKEMTQTINMAKLTLGKLDLPSYFIGRWKLIINVFYGPEKTASTCLSAYCEILEKSNNKKA